MGEQLWGGGDVSSGFRMLSMNSKPSHSGRFLIYWAYICLESDFFFLNSSLIVIVAGRFLLLFATSVSLRPPPPIINSIVALKTQLWLFTICQLMFSDLSTQHMQQKVCRQLLKALKQAFAVFAPPPSLQKVGAKKLKFCHFKQNSC